MDRCIWIYREMRSGSTWLAEFLSKQLNRKHIFLDHYPELVTNLVPNKEHTSYIFSSHVIKNLQPVKLYDDAILIRTARRNLFEQMLSLVFFRTYKNLTKVAANIWNDEDRISFEKVTQNKYCTLSEQNVISWLEQKRELDNQWLAFAKDYPSQTLYYEDFEEGVLLSNTDILIKLDSSGTQKLPDYKRNVFSNYDQIEYWFEQNKNILS